MAPLLQSAAGGLDPTLVGIAGSVLTALLAAIAALWRQSVAESRRKDDLIDRLLKAGFDNAQANQRSVALLEEERRHR